MRIPERGPVEPIVIDPPGFDIRAAWQECQEYSDRMHACERPLAAAAGADPGICSCPACGVMHWAWGRAQRCTACGFEYPTDWWAMYSFGCQAHRWLVPLGNLHDRRLAHPYYRYGYEHPADDPMSERDRIDWRSLNLQMTRKEG